MNGKTYTVTAALALALIAPAGPAIAASAATAGDDGPLGGVLGVFDRGDRDDRREKWERRHRSTFRFVGEIRSVDTEDRVITVDLGDRNRTVRVDEDAKIRRDGAPARLRDLERGDDVRIAGVKRNGRWVAERIIADD